MDIDSASQEDLLAEVIRRGYTVRDLPMSDNPRVFRRDGKRIGGSGEFVGPDRWMNAVNVRLWEIQKA